MKNLLLLGLILLKISNVLAQPAVNVEETAADHERADRFSQRRVFWQPILWIGETPPPSSETRQLEAALESPTPEARFAGLKAFVDGHPNSAWTPSIAEKLAFSYRETGRYSDALKYWEAAWAATRTAESGPAKSVADFTIAHWTSLLASLGRVEQLTDLIEETKERVLFPTTLHQKLVTTREAYPRLRNRPGMAYRCGTISLINVAKALGLTDMNQNILFFKQSTTNGFSLAQLVEFAAEVDMNMTAVAITGDPVVPSVLHWKLDHYAAIIGYTNGYFRVIDPTFGNNIGQWIKKDILLEEASGFYLVPSNLVTDGHRRLETAEARTIFGRGFPNEMPDTDEAECDAPEGECCPEGSGGGGGGAGGGSGGGGGGAPKPCKPGDTPGKDCGPGSGGGGSGGGGNGGQCCECEPKDPNTNPEDTAAPPTTGTGPRVAGMPHWNVSQPFITLWLHDEPLGYQPARGGRISLQLSHKQRQSDITPSGVFSFGTQWTSPWLKYIEGDSVLNQVYHHASGRLLAVGLEYWGYPPEYQNLSSYARLPDESSTLTGWQVVRSDGSKEIYGFIATNDLGKKIAFLTQRITKNNHTNLFHYIPFSATNSLVRLQYIVDGDGKTNTLSYASSSTVEVVKVKDRFDREATFQYDASGQLTNITDVASLSSGFQYQANGWITNMVTPYGSTKFLLYSLYDDYGMWPVEDAVNRAAHVITPAGSHYLYLYRDLATFISTNAETAQAPTNNPLGTIDNNEYTYPQARNSFYWGPLQFANLSTTNFLDFTPNDYFKGTMSHWLHSRFTYYVGNTISYQKAPSLTGTSPGEITWYDYAGPRSSNTEGTQFKPSVIAKVMPDGSTWFKWMQRDERGHVTNVVESYGAGAAIPTRTNIYIYNGFNRVAHIDVNGHMVSSNVFNSDGLIATNYNALGEATTYFYNADKQMSGAVYPSGLVVTNLFYSGGNHPGWLEQTIQIGFTTNSFTYTNGLVHTHTDARGLTRTNQYDALQRVVSTHFSSDGSYLSNKYSNLDLVSSRNRLGIWKNWGFDADRRMTAHTNEIGTIYRIGYCDCGALSYVTNAFGLPEQMVTQFGYDHRGRRTLIINPDGTSITNVYDGRDRLIAISDIWGSTTNTLNQQGMNTCVSNFFGQLAKFKYDVEDRPTNKVTSSGVIISMTYDELGRVLSRWIADGGTNYTFYSTRGVKSIVNELGHTNLIGLDELGRKLGETNANGETLVFTYGAGGDLQRLSHNSSITAWGFDIEGRVISKTNSSSTEIFRYKYDAGNRLTNRWSKGKLDTWYAYDNAGNLTGINYTNSTDVTFGYDALGRLTNMVDAAGTTSYGYIANHLAYEDGPWDGDRVTYSYVGGMRSKLSLAQPHASLWELTYGYDAARRLDSITSPDGTYDYQYNAGVGSETTASRLVKKLLLPNTAYITNAFDTEGRMLSTRLKSSAHAELNAHVYTYNDGNQRISQTRYDGSEIDYTYDDIGQLKTALGVHGSTNRWQEQFSYTYDEAGNLTNRVANGFTNTWTVDSLNQLATYARSTTNYTVAGTTTMPATSVTVNGNSAQRYADNTFVRTNVTVSNGPNTFTAIASDTLGRGDTNSISVNLPTSANYAYDENGNLRFDGKRYFTYDDENQLIKVDVLDSSNNQYSETEFIYDGKNRMRAKKQKPAGRIGTLISSVSLSGTIRNNYSGWVGLEFTVGSSALTVTELGRWVVSGNSGTHAVKIVKSSDGSDLGGAAVTIATSGATPGQVKYATLTMPVILQASTSYLLLTQETSGGDQWYDYNSTLTPSSTVSIPNAAFSSSLPAFNRFGSSNNGYGPVNLKYIGTEGAIAEETHYAYDGMIVIQERNALNVPLVTYTYGLDLSGSFQGAGGIGGLLGRTDHTTSTPTTANYHAAVGGNVTCLVNNEQSVVARYTYDPYGNILSKSGFMSELNCYRFSGKSFDETTGLYYYGYRFYDPNLQRWITQDPIYEIGGVNLFLAIRNDPLNRIDRFGQFAQIGAGAAAGCAGGALGSLIGSALGNLGPNGDSFGQSVCKAGAACAMGALAGAIAAVKPAAAGCALGLGQGMAEAVGGAVCDKACTGKRKPTACAIASGIVSGFAGCLFGGIPGSEWGGDLIKDAVLAALSNLLGNDANELCTLL